MNVNFFRRKKAEPNFLDITLDERTLRLFDECKKNFESASLTVTFEGYKKMPDKGGYFFNPFMIVQNKEQLLTLKHKVLDGILYSLKNGWRSYVVGTSNENSMLFYETQSIIPVMLFSGSMASLSVGKFNAVTGDVSTEAIYDARKDDGLFKGNFYFVPKLVSRSNGESTLHASYFGNITLKRNDPSQRL
jgi:hypothetical protein